MPARAGVGLQGRDLAEAREHGQVAAGTAAHLEDPRPAGRLKLVDQAFQDAATGLEPPVAVLQLAHALVGGLFHQSSRP